ncbi:hypothetical protein DACRYDRAFT_103518 [Dacryopinax primogenitus]|uniref:Uncharacterized protein n=1 Tax=Dacryopinax primogenitus (strain DJM 731) TaxID=1858805 RepID=M5GFT4_DACPD|nr:uncharacterized protein DACRYDRAFT_103518 [Dacryopinax primogenitus]EJU06572.1 hypothetical protein DACRYDRAFT_103518 [Dacryopinax primogenitus]
MVDFSTKRSATEEKVRPTSSGGRPYNHVDEEMTTRLQSIPREIRKSVTEGYRTTPTPGPAPLPRPADKDLPIFRSHRDDLVWSLDLISPEAIRGKELRPLYERFERSGPDGAGAAGQLFALPNFPGPSGERKRRIERETSPSSSAGNSPVQSPAGEMQLDLPAMDVDMDTLPQAAGAKRGFPLPQSGERKIKPPPRRMKNVQSAPAGGLRFGAGAWAATGQNELADVVDEPWEEVDFSAFANQPPE